MRESIENGSAYVKTICQGRAIAHRLRADACKIPSGDIEKGAGTDMKQLLRDKSFLMFAAASLLAGYGCYLKGGSDDVVKGLEAAWSLILLVGPRLLAAFMMAGFIQVLLPKEMITRWVGAKSGVQGILIASAVGVITPGGPMVSFPLVAALFKLGAGYGPLVAYLTSWEILNLYRAAIWDVPFLGLEFTVLRFAVSLFLPLLAGLTAQKIAGFFDRFPDR